MLPALLLLIPIDAAAGKPPESVTEYALCLNRHSTRECLLLEKTCRGGLRLSRSPGEPHPCGALVERQCDALEGLLQGAERDVRALGPGSWSGALPAESSRIVLRIGERSTFAGLTLHPAAAAKLLEVFRIARLSCPRLDTPQHP